MTIGLSFEYRPLSWFFFFFLVLEILFFWVPGHLWGTGILLMGFCALAVATQVLGFREVLEGAGPSNLSQVIGEEQSGVSRRWVAFKAETGTEGRQGFQLVYRTVIIDSVFLGG